MSRVFQETMNDLATRSGCDWDFLIDMYNHIYETRPDGVDEDRFEAGVMKMDWSVRGDGRFERVLVDLCERSGYVYSDLFDILVDMIYDPDDDGDWGYFVGVTMEHDW